MNTALIPTVNFQSNTDLALAKTFHDKYITDVQDKENLRRIAEIIEKLLVISQQIGKVVIVTNAEAGTMNLMHESIAILSSCSLCTLHR
tara:strand:- start:588 stop:854 length:267 start_codon:yes stop_codon:yes gene_type:complete